MPVSTIYHGALTWFSVDILHDYHLRKYFIDTGNVLAEDIVVRPLLEEQYNINKFFTIKPTAQCQQILLNHNLYFRPTLKGFFVGVNAVVNGSTAEPRRSISNDLKLTLEIHLKDSLWLNYSDLPLGGLGDANELITDGFPPYRTQPFRNIYYFSNTKGQYPQLTKNANLSEATLDWTADVKSSRGFNINPNAIGVIELQAFVGSGDPENLIENGILNLQQTPNGWTHPEFKLEIASRALVWKFLKKDGTEADRTALALPFTMIQINPVPLVGGAEEDRPNPRPDNIKFEPTNQQYVAEVYL
jgi:hypothetical protein